LENNQNNPSRRCDDRSGTLPSCASLAVPFVPFQQEGSKKYAHHDALANGTLFPGLNLPFHLKEKAASLPNSALSELQALDFVIAELGLYLDTHKNDTEAFELYKQYVSLAKEGKQRYTEMFGPIVQTDTVKENNFTWTNDPWPWEFCQNGGVK